MEKTVPKRGRKRVRFADMDYEKLMEEESYLIKIKKLIKRNFKLCGVDNVIVLPETLLVKEPRNPPKPPTKKIRKTPLPPMVSNPVTHRLKDFIVNELNGKDVKPLIEKPLFKTDLDPHQNRLNLPINQLQDEFLTPKEKKDFVEGKVLEVMLLGPTLQMHKDPMVMTMWTMNSTANYVLRTNWKGFVKNNSDHLKINTKIQVWSFRRDSRLCLAIACVDRDDHQNEAADGGDGRNEAAINGVDGPIEAASTYLVH